MGGVGIRLTKEAREKVKKEALIYEQALYFILTVQTDPSEDHIIRFAYKNIQTVLDDIDFILSPKSSRSKTSVAVVDVDDVSSIIIKNSSKVENALIYIYEKSNVIETKQAFQEFLVHFKQGDLTKYKSKLKIGYSPYAPDDINGKGGTRKEQEKAPLLTELERKQQDDDEDKCRVCQEKLDKESNAYNATLRFIMSFLSDKQVTNQEDHMLLLSAYMKIMDVDCDLQSSIKAEEVLCEKELSLMLTPYRSKVEKELQGICDIVSNLAVKEAYTQHLEDFRTGFKNLDGSRTGSKLLDDIIRCFNHLDHSRTGFKLCAQDHHSHLQNEDSKIMSSKPKMSAKKKKKKSRLRLRGKGGLGSCKTPSLIDQNMTDYLRVPRFRHGHSACCMQKNHLETSVADWHSSIHRIKLDTGYSRLVFPVCDL